MTGLTKQKGDETFLRVLAEQYIYTSRVYPDITQTSSYRTWILLLWPNPIDCDLTLVLVLP